VLPVTDEVLPNVHATHVQLRDRARDFFPDLTGVFTHDTVGRRLPDCLTSEDLSLASLLDLRVVACSQFCVEGLGGDLV
jgi:hypothetical protein